MTRLGQQRRQQTTGASLTRLPVLSLPASFFTTGAQQTRPRRVTELSLRIGLVKNSFWCNRETGLFRADVQAGPEPLSIMSKNSTTRSPGARNGSVGSTRHRANRLSPEERRSLFKELNPQPRFLRGGNEYEIFQPVRPGDIITSKSRLTEVYEKLGKSGPLIFAICEDEYYNQRAEFLGKNRDTYILLP